MAEDYVNFLTTNAVPKVMTLSEIEEATKADKTLQKLAEITREENWEMLNELSTQMILT